MHHVESFTKNYRLNHRGDLMNLGRLPTKTWVVVCFGNSDAFSGIIFLDVKILIALTDLLIRGVGGWGIPLF